MGILDIFKKNKKESLKPNDILADLMEKVTVDTSLCPLFYKTLISSELIVLKNEVSEVSGRKILEEDTVVKIRTLEDGTIPVFSSTDRIFDNGIITTEVAFMGMGGKDLLELTKGGKLILNPFSNSRKELLPAEIDSILSGKLFEPQIEEVKKGTRIRIGQPANLSVDLVKSIKAFCKIQPEISFAYIAMIHKVDEDEFPHLLVALKLQSKEQEIFGEIGEVVKPYIKEKEFIDFMPLGEGGLSSYFETIEPIYRKDE